jgi:hypothetical protein
MTPSVERDGKLGVTFLPSYMEEQYKRCDGTIFSTVLLPCVHPVSTEQLVDVPGYSGQYLRSEIRPPHS